MLPKFRPPANCPGSRPHEVFWYKKIWGLGIFFVFFLYFGFGGGFGVYFGCILGLGGVLYFVWGTCDRKVRKEGRKGKVPKMWQRILQKTTNIAGKMAPKHFAVPKRDRYKRGRTQKHVNARKRAQKSTNASLQKSAKGRKRAHKSASEARVKSASKQVWNNQVKWELPKHSQERESVLSREQPTSEPENLASDASWLCKNVAMQQKSKCHTVGVSPAMQATQLDVLLAGLGDVRAGTVSPIRHPGTSWLESREATARRKQILRRLL